MAAPQLPRTPLELLAPARDADIGIEAVNHGLEMTLPEGLYLEATLFSLCATTEDMKEGTTAFLEKRPAKFVGK